MGRGQWAEDRGQRAEVRGQKAEGRGQRAEGRGQKAEGRDKRVGLFFCCFDLSPLRYESELFLSQSVEIDVQNITKVLDDLGSIGADLEMQIQSLTEELAALNRNHQEVGLLMGLGDARQCGEVPRRSDQPS